jgi:hypothetical protein
VLNHDLPTALGRYCVTDEPDDHVCIGLRDIDIVVPLGPDSVYEWSLDQEEALLAAAAAVGATVSLETPGGWRLQPGTALPALMTKLLELSATWPRTERRIRRG